MGRQICFFATPFDFLPLLRHIVNNGWYILDKTGVRVPLLDVESTIQNSFDNKFNIAGYYAAKDGLEIHKEKYDVGFLLNPIISEVIEINPCSLQTYVGEKKLDEKNRYEHARFWYSRECYDDKEKIVVKSKEIDKMFDSLVRQVKKNAKISKNASRWYILPDAYRLYKAGEFIPCSAISKIEF